VTFRRRLQVPLIFHANGGTGKLERIAAECKADVIGLDWATDMAEARRIFGAGHIEVCLSLCLTPARILTRISGRVGTAGPDVTLQGNVDPMILFGSEAQINAAVDEVGVVYECDIPPPQERRLTYVFFHESAKQRVNTG
jgi:uroporphyrinogen-III decarboxylase